MIAGGLLMRLLLGALLCLSPTMSEAQESCDVRSTVENVGNTVVFKQLMFCGDGDPVMTFTCTKGKDGVRVSLPVGDFEKGEGETQKASFEVAGRTVRKQLRIVAEGQSEIVLEPDDALWKALAAPGVDVTVTTEGSTTSVGLIKESEESFLKWQAMCAK
jgi:hypothetical protein